MDGRRRANSSPPGAVPSPTLDETALRQLLATPPPAFVAARNELAKALRGDKRRDEAAAVAALRRPGWDDWALNAVAVREPDAVAAFADAADAVRGAQAAAIEGRDGPDVRTALRALRDRTAEVAGRAAAALAGEGRGVQAGELVARLAGIAADPGASAQLVAGMLGAGETATTDVFAGLIPTDRPGRRGPVPDVALDDVAEAASGPVLPAERRPSKATAAQEERRRRRREAAEVAARDHEAAVAALGDADAELAAAESAVAAAESALRRAERTVTAAAGRRQQAADAAARAARALERARAALS